MWKASIAFPVVVVLDTAYRFSEMPPEFSVPCARGWLAVNLSAWQSIFSLPFIDCWLLSSPRLVKEHIRYCTNDLHQSYIVPHGRYGPLIEQPPPCTMPALRRTTGL